jgi:hypothetical protein
MLKLYKQRYTKFVASPQINQVYIATVKRQSKDSQKTVKRQVRKFYKSQSPSHLHTFYNERRISHFP